MGKDIFGGSENSIGIDSVMSSRADRLGDVQKIDSVNCQEINMEGMNTKYVELSITLNPEFIRICGNELNLSTWGGVEQLQNSVEPQ